MKSNIFSKISFFFKKIPAIVIVGDRKKEVKEKIKKILKKYFQEGKDFLIFTANNKNIKNLNFFLKYSRKPIFVATSMNAIRKNVNKVTSSLSYKTNFS